MLDALLVKLVGSEFVSGIRREEVDRISRECAITVRDIALDHAVESKRDALSELVDEQSKSLDALDGIMGVLVNRGVDSGIAARLALRYWAKGWEKRLMDRLVDRFKVTDEELRLIRAQIDARLTVWEEKR